MMDSNVDLPKTAHSYLSTSTVDVPKTIDSSKVTSAASSTADIISRDIKANDAEPEQTQARSIFEDDAEQTAYPTGWKLTLIVTALFISTFIVAVSQTVLAAAIPTISDEFNSYNDIAWYSTGESTTAVALQLPFGVAYTLLNNKWTYLASLIVYLVGSAVCGSAATSPILIVGRAIQGVGCAGVLGGTFIIIARISPLRKRSLFAGLVGAAYAIASVLGPVIGGAFTTNVSWRWTFYFNLPIGAATIPVILFCLSSSIARTSPELKTSKWTTIIMKFDPFGTILLLTSLVCLMLALQWGGAEYPWSDGRVIAVLVVFGITIIPWFVLQYYQGDNATVPLSVIKQRTVASSNLYVLFLNASFGIFIYYLPIWFQSIQGDSAEDSGIKQLALSISTAISSILAGGLVAALGYYNPFVIMGSILTTAGGALLYKVNFDSGLGILIGAQVLAGVGVGFGSEQVNVAVQTVLPDSKIAKGTSLTLFTRLLGVALSVPVAQSAFQQSLSQKLGKTVAEAIYNEGGATDIRANLEKMFGVGTEALNDALTSVNYALTRGFMVAMIVAALSFPFGLFLEWKSVKKEKREEEDAKEKRGRGGKVSDETELSSMEERQRKEAGQEVGASI